MKNPVIYFQNNLVFTQDNRSILNSSGIEAWAIYKIPGEHYTFLSERNKILMLQKYETLFKEVDSEAHILSIPVKVDIFNNYLYLKENLTGDLTKLANDFLEEEKESYKNKESIDYNSYNVFFVVNITKKNKTNNFKDILKSMAEPITLINNAFGIETSMIPKKDMALFIDGEKTFFEKHKQSIVKADEYDIEMLLRTPFIRGNKAPLTRNRKDFFDKCTNKVINRNWRLGTILNKTGDLYVQKNMITTLMNYKVSGKLRHIEVDSDGEMVLQSTLAVAYIPEMDFPGCEWIYRLQNECGCPVWTTIKYVKKDYKEVLKEIKQRKQDINDQKSHNKEINKDLNLEHIEQEDKINTINHEVKENKEPFLYTTIYITVTGKDNQELALNIFKVKSFFELFDIECHVATGEQINLFNESFLGFKQTFKDYMMPIPALALASSMIMATNKIGHDNGINIGTTNLGKPVYLDPFYASKNNQSPSMAFVGGLGTGKSTAVNYLVLISALLGAKVFIVDPKNDRNSWKKNLPELDPYINYIDLKPDSVDEGKLDLCSVLFNNMTDKNYATRFACDHTLSILGVMLGYSTKDERFELLSYAVGDVFKEEDPCMEKIIEKLFELSEKDPNPSSRSKYYKIHKKLSYVKDNTKYGKLLFGDGSKKSIDLSKPITIVNTKNLDIPPDYKSEDSYSHDERIGIATLLCLNAIGVFFCSQDKNILKIYVQDESSVLKRSKEGRTLLNSMIKMGRSENTPVILIGQNVSDISDVQDGQDIFANLGIRFAFKTGSKEEAKNIAKFMECYDNIDEITHILTAPPQDGGLETGECLLRDNNGNVGRVSININIERYLNAFNTTPGGVQNE